MRGDARAIVNAALAACDPGILTGRALDSVLERSSRIMQVSAIAAGKAAAGMLARLKADARVRTSDVVVSRGGHPLPNTASVEAGEAAMRAASAARSRGAPILVLLSGGASAMFELPPQGISLDDLVALNRLLLASGLPIAPMNAVRKHASAIKGGQLAAAAGESITLAISDVHAPIEDDPASIGSGPTVADPSTFVQAQAALADAGVLEHAPASVRDRLARGVRGAVDETPKPGDPRLARARFVLAGSRRDAMDGAAKEAAARGFAVMRIQGPTLGEAADAAREFVSRAAELARRTHGAVCVIASGETTVTLDESAHGGRGGRNQEFAVAAASAIERLGPCVLASVGTDGIDGPTDAAGAIVDSSTAERARALGIDLERARGAHDTYPALASLGDLLITGATGTNVGDVQVLLLPGSGLEMGN
ncbi:MAG: glycerate kinase type-2 family protein [Vicinamibacterales bacterium]